jgi:triacylglycerol lipase
LTQSYNIISNPSSKKPIIGKIFTDNKNRAWVSFRGTQTLDELLADLNFHEKSIAKKHKQVTMCSTENIKVHQGFLEEYTTFRSKILQYFKQNSSYDQIIITGHSLGSALAVLLSYDLMNSDQSTKLVVYLFACPRVGNLEFQKAYKVPCFSIVNRSDLIPTLPFSVMPNNSHSVNIFSHVGTQISFDDNWKSLGNNHQIPIYAANILNT